MLSDEIYKFTTTILDAIRLSDGMFITMKSISTNDSSFWRRDWPIFRHLLLLLIPPIIVSWYTKFFAFRMSLSWSCPPVETIGEAIDVFQQVLEVNTTTLSLDDMHSNFMHKQHVAHRFFYAYSDSYVNSWGFTHCMEPNTMMDGTMYPLKDGTQPTYARGEIVTGNYPWRCIRVFKGPPSIILSTSDDLVVMEPLISLSWNSKSLLNPVIHFQLISTAQDTWFG